MKRWLMVLVLWVAVVLLALCGCYSALDIGRGSWRLALGEAAEKWPPPAGGLYESDVGTDPEPGASR